MRAADCGRPSFAAFWCVRPGRTLGRFCTIRGGRKLTSVVENRKVLELDRLETDPQDPSLATPRARSSSPRDVGKLRITFVLPQRSLSGGARVVVQYGNELIDRGHTVTIACMPKAWPRRPRALLHQIQRDLRSFALRDHVDDFKGAVLTVRSHKLASAVPDADVVLATHWSTAEPVADLPASKGQKVQFLQGYEAHTSGPERVDAHLAVAASPGRRVALAPGSGA